MTERTAPKWWTTHEASRDQVLPHVYIMNLDVAQSSTLESENALELKKGVNQFQEETETLLKKKDFFVQHWSGDGLVALAQDKENPTDCIEAAIELQRMFAARRKKGGVPWENVGLRIAIFYGQVPYDPNMGKIIAADMNKAGHLQKQCPPDGVVIDETTYRNIPNKSALKFSFEQDITFTHGEDTIPAYSIQEREPKGLLPHDDLERRILAEFQAKGYELVVRAPAAFYISGEFCNIFGHSALIAPIPLFTYVGIAASKTGRFAVEEVLFPSASEDNYTRDHRFRLRFPTQQHGCLSKEQRTRITNEIKEWGKLHGRDVTPIRIRSVSTIPSGCGLNASSAFSCALSLAVWAYCDPKRFTPALRSLSDYSEADIPVRQTDYWDVYKLGWSLDNVFHSGASSGCGVFASLFGSPDGYPLVYMSERRGLDGTFPFHFGDAGTSPSCGDKDFERMRSAGFRTKHLCTGTKASSIPNIDCALIFSNERASGRTTGDMITEFLKGSEDNVRKYGEKLNGMLVGKGPLRNDFLRAQLVDLAKRSPADKQIGHRFPQQLTDIGISATRDLFVEWVAESLGCLSFAVQMAFLSGPNELLFRYLNAYQELLCASGVSASLLDLFNYKSDLFRYEVEQAAGAEKAARFAFGTKLTGGGGGGDLLIMGPRGELQKQLPALRRKLGETSSTGTPSACHYYSWARNTEKPVVKSWRKNKRGTLCAI